MNLSPAGRGTARSRDYVTQAMSRFSVVLSTLLLAPVVFGISPVSAAPRTSFARIDLQAATESPDPDANPSPAVKARYAGVVEGIVAAVDYRVGMISIQMPGRRMDVTVLPSTTIQSSTNTFHTIADIVKGQRIQVVMSQRGNNFIAEIIHLR